MGHAESHETPPNPNPRFELWVTGDDLQAERARVAARRLVQFLDAPLSALKVLDTLREAPAARDAEILLTPLLLVRQHGKARKVIGPFDDIPGLGRLLATPLSGSPDPLATPKAADLVGNNARLLLDSDGAIKAINEAARALLGLSASAPWPSLGQPSCPRGHIEARLADGRWIDLTLWPVAHSGQVMLELIDREGERRLRAELQHHIGRIALLESRLERIPQSSEIESTDDLAGILELVHARAQRSGLPAIGILANFVMLAERSAQGGSGHTAHEILVILGTRLRELIRPGDRLVRLDAGTLLIVLEGLRPAEARAVAERILPALIAMEADLGEELGVLEPRLVFGLLPSWLRDRAGLTRYFEGALARAREAEKPTIVSLRGGGQILDVQAALDAIIANPDSLRVEARPVVSLHERDPRGTVLGIHGPAGPLADPKVLFAQAQDHGRLIEIDLCALAVAARALQERPFEQRVFVRITPTTLVAAPFEEILRCLAPAQHHRLVLLISDRQLAGNLSDLARALDRFQAAGIQVALDDVRPSSGVYFAMIMLRPRWIRLDRDFTHNIGELAGQRRQLAQLMEACQVIEAQVIADGVEQAADLLALRDLGVELGQGGRLCRSRIIWPRGSESIPADLHHLPDSPH